MCMQKVYKILQYDAAYMQDAGHPNILLYAHAVIANKLQWKPAGGVFKN